MRNKILEETWSGTKPGVSHFRIFGCISRVHVPDNIRVKLDNESLKCILFGVSEEAKAYRLSDPISQRMIVSRVLVLKKIKVGIRMKVTKKPLWLIIIG